MKHVLPLLLLPLFLLHCGDSGSPTNPPAPATTTVAAVQTSEFTLSARNCFFRTSRQLTTLAVGESFTIDFRTLRIDEMNDQTWAHAVQFWLGDPDDDDAIALDLIWNPDSQWTIALIVPDGIFTTGMNELISVGGRLREITIVRSEGLSEWLLDGVVVLQLVDDQPERAVHTAVVGADALFRYETNGASTLRASSTPETAGECMTGQMGPCAQLPN